MKKKTVLIPLVCSLFCMIVFSACSEKPPEIAQTFHQISIVHDIRLDRYYEQLSFFTHVVDEDGNDDVESVYLIHDEQELFWKLDEGRWRSKENEGEFWIGTNQITMNDFSPLPRGDYRLIVIDTAGERDRYEMFLPLTTYEPGRMEFPSAEVKDGVIEIRSSYNRHTLWFYQDSGEPVTVFKTGEKQVPITDIFETNEEQVKADYYYCYVFLQEKDIGLLRGPYFF